MPRKGQTKPKNIGFAQRFMTRLIELGFVQGNGEADIQRWCREKIGYVTQLMYEWKKGTEPNWANLFQFARDLEVDAEWLINGTTPSEIKVGGTREAESTTDSGRFPAGRSARTRRPPRKAFDRRRMVREATSSDSEGTYRQIRKVR